MPDRAALPPAIAPFKFDRLVKVELSSRTSSFRELGEGGDAFGDARERGTERGKGKRLRVFVGESHVFQDMFYEDVSSSGLRGLAQTFQIILYLYCDERRDIL